MAAEQLDDAGRAVEMGCVTGRLVQMYIHRGQKEPVTKYANQLFEMLWRAIAKAP